MSRTTTATDRDPDRAPAAAFAAIVVAAGAGTRFGADRPKALLDLAGRPLVHRAAAAMVAAGAGRLVVVVPAGWTDRFAEALTGLPVDRLVSGGPERTDSVRNGLAALDDIDAPPVVLVQDAARPLVPRTVTRRVVAAVAGGAPAVVPAVPVTDTIRELTGAATSRSLDRGRLRAVQTPQGFDLQALRSAYAAIGADAVTDDAGVCERAGYPVTVVDGAPESFKITRPADLVLAELLLAEPTPAATR